MPKSGRCVLILIGVLWSLVAWAADPGDNVQYKGTPGAPEINESIIKEAGNRVLTEASTVSERPPVFVATTENIVLSGEQSIDQPLPEDEEDVPILTANSRVMVHLQTDPTENGIYVSSAGAWTRAVDADHTDELVNNFTVYVQSGVVYGQTSFRLTTTGTITLGTTPINFIPLPSARVVPLSQLPVNPAPGTSYLVSEHDGTCQAPGVVTQRCEWDGDSWELLGGGGGSTLNAACAAGTDCALTNLPPERPFILAPEGMLGVQLRTYGESGNVSEDCVDGSTLIACQPSYIRIYPGQTSCLEMVILDDPATEVCVNSLTVTDVGGIGTGITRSDRGPYANLPSDPYVDQTYYVNNCLTGACTAGGGTVRVLKQWTGSAWVNLTGTASLGDIEAVWNCSAGDCSALTAASGDSLDAGAATASSPTTRSTSLPGTCTEGQHHQDTDSQGTESYVCVAANTWIKIARAWPWHLGWSAAGALVDGTTCTQAAQAVLNGGPSIRAISCGDSATGTIEFSFDTPAQYDGGAMQVCFEWNDPVDADSVIDLAVIGQFRASGAVTNNTWSTPVELSLTLTTAHAGFIGCASVTPNAAAAGVGRTYIKATVDAAGSFNDTGNARCLGGFITGGSL